jgi:hypothetical protein
MFFKACNEWLTFLKLHSMRLAFQFRDTKRNWCVCFAFRKGHVFTNYVFFCPLSPTTNYQRTFDFANAFRAYMGIYFLGLEINSFEGVEKLPF